jgi:hypothetical protein
MPLSFEYLNYFIYVLVLFMAFLIIIAIPMGNAVRVANSVPAEEFEEDLERLNVGYTFMLYSPDIVFHENGNVTFYPTTFTYTDYYYDSYYDYSEVYHEPKVVTVSRSDAEQIIQDYIATYNKYSAIPVRKSPADILALCQSAADGDYYGDCDYEAQDALWDVQMKISEIAAMHRHHTFGIFSDAWFWKISLSIIAMFAMLVWMLKQMKLRQFVFGFIAICLTPLFVAIVGVIMFEVIGIRGEEEESISFVALLAYAIFATLSIRAFLSSTLNNSGYVITMYLQFFLPIFPFFFWLFILYERNVYYGFGDEDAVINVLYWSGWVMGLLSITLFKPMYTKFRTLPSKN